jgi:hypothetical protein
MSGAPSPLAGLLAECDAQGIRLLLTDDGRLTIDAPQVVLTPGLLDRLKAHKSELLKLLRVSSDFPDNTAESAEPAPITEKRTHRMPPELRRPAGATVDTCLIINVRATTVPICRCGSTTWRDVSIHDGQSVRRDCARCVRFIDFPIWYEKGTLQNEK